LHGHEERLNFAIFNYNGSRIVTAGGDLFSGADSTARLWNTATKENIAILRGHEATVWTAVFSPDGSRIVTASRDKTARIWDAASATEISVLRGHGGGMFAFAFRSDGEVFDAVFSPDGSRIVTASEDRSVRIWNASRGDEMVSFEGHQRVSFEGHQRDVNSAAFSPDGSRIVTASEDGSIKIWDARYAAMSTRDLIADTCARLLHGISKLKRDEMRLAGYPDSVQEIDVCAGVE
jgi:WD40 repeat protein